MGLLPLVKKLGFIIFLLVSASAFALCSAGLFLTFFSLSLSTYLYSFVCSFSLQLHVPPTEISLLESKIITLRACALHMCVNDD
jgi:hypothetical protein